MTSVVPSTDAANLALHVLELLQGKEASAISNRLRSKGIPHAIVQGGGGVNFRLVVPPEWAKAARHFLYWLGFLPDGSRRGLVTAFFSRRGRFRLKETEILLQWGQEAWGDTPTPLAAAISPFLFSKTICHWLYEWSHPRWSKATFAGLELVVGRGTFFPMQTSETLVSVCLEGLERMPSPVIVDVGTGSGAIALGIAAARRDASVYATEPSRSALRSAGVNAIKLGQPKVHFFRGNLLDPLPRRLTRKIAAIVANMPYVAPGDRVAPAVVKRAVFGRDADGLGFYRELIPQAAAMLADGGLLVMELPGARWDSLFPDLEAAGFTAIEARPAPLPMIAGVARLTR